MIDKLPRKNTVITINKICQTLCPVKTLFILHCVLIPRKLLSGMSIDRHCSRANQPEKIAITKILDNQVLLFLTPDKCGLRLHNGTQRRETHGCHLSSGSNTLHILAWFSLLNTSDSGGISCPASSYTLSKTYSSPLSPTLTSCKEASTFLLRIFARIWAAPSSYLPAEQAISRMSPPLWLGFSSSIADSSRTLTVLSFSCLLPASRLLKLKLNDPLKTGGHSTQPNPRALAPADAMVPGRGLSICRLF